MQYISRYQSPMVKILLAADEIGLTDDGLRDKNILPFIWKRTRGKRTSRV